MSSRPSSFTLTTPGSVRLYSTQELLQLPPPEWLVHSIMPAGGLVGLYGPPGHGKSFMAIDVAMSIASGVPWQGHDTKAGYVVYFSAEGNAGIGKRAHAWLLEHHIAAERVNMAWLTEPIWVTDESEDLTRVLGRINMEIDERPALVIVDTLARCFDGDENTQEDMGRFIAGVDKIRHEYGATVLVVHHTRLAGDRERGNTAFRGAADTMISVEMDGEGAISVSCNKQKDAEDFNTKFFKLKVVPKVESCVMVNEQQDRQSQIIALVESQGNLGAGFGFIQKNLSSEMSPATLKRYVVSLVEKKELLRISGVYWTPGSFPKDSEP